MNDIELVKALLDAGRDFRIAEQVMADIPINAPREPSRPDAYDAWQEKLYEWKTSKVQAEILLQGAATRYLGLLFDAVADQVVAYISEHEDDHHHKRYSESVGDD